MVSKVSVIDVPVGKMVETNVWKFFRSDESNFDFNKNTGFTRMWGKTKEDDVEVFPMPTILDIEITTICNGPDNKLCGFCYKGNSSNGHNMTFLEFKTILDKMPWLTQIALGADAQGVTNPDMLKMMHYARSRGIIPNLTIADVTPETADKLVEVAGAIAVSVYKHAGFEVAYRSIDNLLQAAKRINRKIDINIHFMISAKTLPDAYRVVEAYQTDPRLRDMNAIVFLGLKQKGRGRRMETVGREEYKTLVDHCMVNQVRFGFDSCSAPAFLEAVQDSPDYDKLFQMVEPCESTCISSYINERGVFYPCSFTEGEGNWKTGIDVLSADDFIKDVWNHPRTESFRQALLNNKDGLGCRNCPVHIVCSKDFRTDDFKPTMVGNIL